MPPARNRASHARTRPFRIAVLDTQAASREQMVTTVAEIGIEVCVEGPLRQNVVALIHRTGCDAALLGMDSPDGAEVRLMPEIDCPVVLCSKNTGPDMLIAAQKIGAMAFLVPPIRPEQVMPALALATSLFREGQFLRRALAERKVIEQAKGRVMERQRITEDAAFRWLRRRAMNTRARIADVARAVLSEETESGAQSREDLSVTM
jgi:AmiR/NasT family two-component response regulator